MSRTKSLDDANIAAVLLWFKEYLAITVVLYHVTAVMVAVHCSNSSCLSARVAPKSTLLCTCVLVASACNIENSLLHGKISLEVYLRR